MSELKNQKKQTDRDMQTILIILEPKKLINPVRRASHILIETQKKWSVTDLVCYNRKKGETSNHPLRINFKLIKFQKGKLE